MTPNEPDCVEDLIVLSRRRELGPAEAEQLRAHLEVCADCRALARVGSDFARVAGRLPGDERLVERALAVALSPRLRRVRWRMPPALAVAAGVLLLVAGVATGARLLVLPRLSPAPQPPPAVPEAKPRRTHAARPVPPVVEQAPVLPPPAQVVPSPSPGGRPMLALPAPARKKDAPPVAAATSSPFVPPQVEPPAMPLATETAAHLLAAANRARAAGELSRAVAGYQRLQRQFALSNEAAVSRVSLATLLLKQGAAAEALAAFDGYLGQRPGGPLVEEALDGKARALQRLGRASDERAVLRALIERFPGSAYAARARLRLGVGP
jgi:hypothetical protein